MVWNKPLKTLIELIRIAINKAKIIEIGTVINVIIKVFGRAYLIKFVT